MVDISDEEFEELVNDALDSIPEQFLRELGNVVLLIEDFHPDTPDVLGLYDGVSLTEQTLDGFDLPATITIYRQALKNACITREQLKQEVRITVGHEIGHHFGIDDDHLHELGWG